jgi:hypothetical protein
MQIGKKLSSLEGSATLLIDGTFSYRCKHLFLPNRATGGLESGFSAPALRTFPVTVTVGKGYRLRSSAKPVLDEITLL